MQHSGFPTVAVGHHEGAVKTQLTTQRLNDHVGGRLTSYSEDQAQTNEHCIYIGACDMASNDVTLEIC